MHRITLFTLRATQQFLRQVEALLATGYTDIKRKTSFENILLAVDTTRPFPSPTSLPFCSGTRLLSLSQCLSSGAELTSQRSLGLHVYSFISVSFLPLLRQKSPSLVTKGGCQCSPTPLSSTHAQLCLRTAPGCKRTKLLGRSRLHGPSTKAKTKILRLH